MQSAIRRSVAASQVTARRVESGEPTCATQLSPIDALPDSELIVRVAQREERALRVILDRYSSLVYTIALRIVGDRELAEEVAQDVFQAAWQSAPSFQPNGSLAAWLAGIARHRAIDATRSRSFRARAREDLLKDDWTASAASVTSDTDILLLRAVMQAALVELPAVQRQAIELAYYSGLTHTEIAARLGEPIGTVKSRMRLGLIKLRDLLDLEEDR